MTRAWAWTWSCCVRLDQRVTGTDLTGEAGQQALALGAKVRDEAVLPHVERLLHELFERGIVSGSENIADALGEGEAALMVAGEAKQAGVAFHGLTLARPGGFFKPVASLWRISRLAMAETSRSCAKRNALTDGAS